MIVRFKKLERGGAALSCIRTDGTSTWQKPKPSQATFYAIHDLTHFAVETELESLDGFFTLIAKGWEISDFDEAASTERGLPPEALLVELIVGFFDSERSSGDQWTDAQFNQYIETYDKDSQFPAEFKITDEQLQRIRRHKSALFQQWQETKLGETLELEFRSEK